jgi:hypothetical protein
MKVISSNGDLITDMGTWFRYAPPEKGELHWKDGRSAKEAAKAWVGSGSPTVPPEIASLIASHADTADLNIHTIIPEFETRLDNYRGKGRKHDVLALADGPQETAVIGIEAKADETFGPIITKYRQGKVGTASKVPNRIDGLLRGLFGRPWEEDLGALRYQLVHGVAGTLIEAAERNADLAIFVVHEFVSNLTTADKRARNDEDLASFVLHFTDTILTNKSLLGPFTVVGHGRIPAGANLYLGKVTTERVFI